MSARASHGSALLVVWSPTRVRVYDPITRQTLEGNSIAECLPDSAAGREVIVAVAQRSVFIRVLPVPLAPREEIAKMLPFKLGQVLPLAVNETVSGYRLARETNGDGPKAVVGAMRTDSLRRIHEESQSKGVKVRAVVPLAFGSWLAVREKALPTCAVVEAGEDFLSIDVVADGELRYSRVVPLPESQEEIDAEVAASFDLARVDPGPVVSAATPEIRADIQDRQHTYEHLADPRTIDRLLFSLELPEKTQARHSKAAQRAPKRAITALAVAVLLGVYAAQIHISAQTERKAELARQSGQVRKALAEQKQAESVRDRYRQMLGVLNVAFAPAQTPADAINVLGEAAPKGVWLTGLTLERGKPLLIRGTTTDGKLVARYVENLSKGTRFRDVRLVSATKGTIGARNVVLFAISGHAIGNLPIEEVKR